MKRRMTKAKAQNPEPRGEKVKDPKDSFRAMLKKADEPDVTPERKRPKGHKERLRNVRI